MGVKHIPYSHISAIPYYLSIEKTGFVYMLTNIKHSVLYIGVTSSIERRTLQHKMGDGGVFTSKYNCKRLVYFEEIPLITDAIAREKQLKTGNAPGRKTSSMIKIQIGMT